MSAKDHDPRFHEHMKWLGHIAAISASLELSVNMAIWELANVERSRPHRGGDHDAWPPSRMVSNAVLIWLSAVSAIAASLRRSATAISVTP
jgi:hypothetical protein